MHMFMIILCGWVVLSVPAGVLIGRAMSLGSEGLPLSQTRADKRHKRLRAVHTMKARHAHRAQIVLRNGNGANTCP